MVEENATSFAFRGANGTDMFDAPSFRLANRFNDYGVITTSNDVFYVNYSHWYQLIAKANLALYAAELPQIVWASGNDKAYVIAQAKFFRAYCYRNLCELYGGVPIVKEITSTARYDFVRATRAETYQFAIDEMENILPNLPETSSQIGRIVRGAAQHNLCQLHLALGITLQQDGKESEAKQAYAKSIVYGDDLIDKSVYGLMSERFGSRKNENPEFYFAQSEKDQIEQHLYSEVGHPIEGNVIWDMFQEGNQNYQEGNKEAIWVAQIDYQANKVEDGASKLQYSRIYGPVFRDGGRAHLAGMMEDAGGRGISQIIPTRYTRDIIYEGKFADDLRNSNAVWRRLFLGNVASSPYYGKPVPWDATGFDEKVLLTFSTCFPVSCKIATDKYTGLEDGQNRGNLFRDEYIIRLAETVLLRAEAKWRNGDSNGAASDINLLRNRAKCAHLVAAGDVNVDLILDERARELVYEECRWNTLLRMGGKVAVERIKKYAYWNSEVNASLNFEFNLWPIPQVVRDTNKDAPIAQNPGWENR
ncbi:hypothetical protein AwDysgo_14640 [Bacteroidales bacterium]|nr:hypothetical protein AwDysgo_14640 [Bacteroidales bacterium]